MPVNQKRRRTQKRRTQRRRRVGGGLWSWITGKEEQTQSPTQATSTPAFERRNQYLPETKAEEPELSLMAKYGPKLGGKKSRKMRRQRR